MGTTRWLLGAMFAVAIGCANAQVLSEGPPPPPPENQKPGFDPSWLPRPIKAGRCDGSTCLLTIRAAFLRPRRGHNRGRVAHHHAIAGTVLLVVAANVGP